MGALSLAFSDRKRDYWDNVSAPPVAPVVPLSVAEGAGDGIRTRDV
jgi:hypothetical protein